MKGVPASVGPTAPYFEDPSEPEKSLYMSPFFACAGLTPATAESVVRPSDAPNINFRFAARRETENGADDDDDDSDDEGTARCFPFEVCEECEECEEEKTEEEAEAEEHRCASFIEASTTTSIRTMFKIQTRSKTQHACESWLVGWGRTQHTTTLKGGRSLVPSREKK